MLTLVAACAVPAFVLPVAATGSPTLVCVVFDDDLVLVSGRDFPEGADVEVRAAAGQLAGAGLVRATDQGRMLLAFRLPGGFSGRVEFSARSGPAQATISTDITVPGDARTESDQARPVLPPEATGSPDSAASGSPVAPDTSPATPAASGSAAVSGAAGVPGSASASAPPASGAQPAPADRVAPQQVPPAAGGSGRPGDVGPDWGAPILTEDFDGSSIDTTKWGVYHSPDVSLFPRSRDNARVSGGELQLVGRFDAQGRDLSGGISSNLNQLYGRWEARIRVDRGSGYSGVMLLWPRTENWPTDGEIDVVEVTGGDRQGAIMVSHNGPRNQTTMSDVDTDFTQWRTIGVEWTADHIAYFVDGVNVYTIQQRTGNGGAPTVPTTSPMHLALQLDKGCAQGLPCRDSSTPAEVVMHVDWVQIYGPSR